MTIMQIHRILLAGCLAAALLPATGAPVPPDTPLVTDGAIKVDTGDFEASLQRIPESRRGEARLSFDKVATVVDNIYVGRMLAAKAREAGLDKDPVVQRRLVQVQEALLADLYIQRLERTAPAVDLEQRARELYKADQAKYVVPEHVYLQQILVGLNGRTREMALARAREVSELAKSGKEDFLALAARYSEDGDMKRNGGDAGYNATTSYPPPVARATEAMKTKGEVSDPIETERGFFVVRFIDRKKAETMKFEQVRRKLIEAEKEKIAKTRLEDVLQGIRSSGTGVLHRENIEALVIPPAEYAAKLKAAADAAAKDAASTDAPARVR